MTSLKIALLGYGKMGKEIEIIAKEKSHQVIAYIDNNKDWQKQNRQLEQADIAIDFSIPESVEKNISKCFDIGLPIVVGTTGWYKNILKIKNECEAKSGTMIWASNFSIGMNIFFKINAVLAELMAKFPDYNAHIHEIHHTQKVDAPSGTAISIANGIMENNNKFNSWQLYNKQDSPMVNTLPITYERIEQVPGTHIVSYKSKIDQLIIKHEANNRQGFAIGAVLAAEWLVGKKGFFNMDQLMSS